MPQESCSLKQIFSSDVVSSSPVVDFLNKLGQVAMMVQVVALCLLYVIRLLVVGTLDTSDKQLINRIAGRSTEAPVFRSVNMVR
jgi:hypothetical protein